MNIVSQKITKIRKPHNCWGCTAIIKPPDSMEAVVCTDGGKIYSVYWCDVCRGILTKDFEQGDEFGYGELMNYDN